MKRIFFYLVVFFIACQNNKTQYKYYVFEDNKWNSDSIVSFNFDNIDTTASYDIYLKIRHSVDYRFQNLFLFSNINNEKDTIEIFLSQKNGKWNGKGFGDIKEIDVLISKEASFENFDEANYSFEQAMRYNDLEKIIELDGLFAIGLAMKINE